MKDVSQKNTQLLGVNISTSSKSEILEYITKSLQIDSKKCFIVTPNPEILVYAYHHPHFKHILNQAQLAIPDGMGLIWASRLLGKGVKGRITGVDFMLELCKICAENNVGIGLLGGRGSVAERTAQCLREKFREIKIVFVKEDFDETPALKRKSEKYYKYSKEILKQLSGVDILFVAYGFPKQEEWIYEHLENLPVKVAMGVGGAFDFISGIVPRAPAWIQAIGLEWLFRLIKQPWRWKRQLALSEFILLVLKEKLVN